MSIFPGIPVMPSQAPLPPLLPDNTPVKLPVKSIVPFSYGPLGTRTFAEPMAADGKPVYVEVGDKVYMKRQSALTKEELEERGEW
tara:strand:+ start:4048 stop:4302 length:255 start_codon:yes stop_codon:yes gene_type:complete